MKKSVKAKLIEVQDRATEYIRVGADLYEFIDEIESKDLVSNIRKQARN